MFLRKKTYPNSGSLSKLAWIRFCRNRLAFSSFAFIVFVTIIAIAGYWVTPDKTPMVNEQNLLLATLKPGAAVQVLKVYKNQDIPRRNIIYQLLYGQENRYQDYAFRNMRFSADTVIITEFSKDASGLELKFHLADVAYPLQNDKQILKRGNQLHFVTREGKIVDVSIVSLREQVKLHNVATKTFWLGTDRYGRAVLSQLIIGTRISLSVGF
ncbi:MAG TPA: hypothetical protein PKN21_10975, partial [Bacteroidales bacterium]|nr:hypothetical protein [Bacteroidales bacterium]